MIARSTEVPEEHALQGFHAVQAAVVDPTESERLLAGVLGFEERGEHEWEARGDNRGGSIVFEPARTRGLGGGSRARRRRARSCPPCRARSITLARPVRGVY